MSVRQRPNVLRPRTEPGCRLCGGELPSRRHSWCSDGCVDLWLGADKQTLWLPQLVALHGHRCWECGELGYVPGWRGPGRCLQDRDGRYYVPLGPPIFDVRLDVDHVRPLWSLDEIERTEFRWWTPFNLQLLCSVCHKAKTAREAAVRAKMRAGAAGWVEACRLVDTRSRVQLALPGT